MEITSLRFSDNGTIFEAAAIKLASGDTIVVNSEGEIARYGPDNKLIGTFVDEESVKTLVAKAGAITA